MKFLLAQFFFERYFLLVHIVYILYMSKCWCISLLAQQIDMGHIHLYHCLHKNFGTNPKNSNRFVLVYFKESMCLSVSEVLLLVVIEIFPLKNCVIQLCHVTMLTKSDILQSVADFRAFFISHIELLNPCLVHFMFIKQHDIKTHRQIFFHCQITFGSLLTFYHHNHCLLRVVYQCKKNKNFLMLGKVMKVASNLH